MTSNKPQGYETLTYWKCEVKIIMTFKEYQELVFLMFINRQGNLFSWSFSIIKKSWTWPSLHDKIFSTFLDTGSLMTFTCASRIYLIDIHGASSKTFFFGVYFCWWSSQVHQASDSDPSQWSSHTKWFITSKLVGGHFKVIMHVNSLVGSQS